MSSTCSRQASLTVMVLLVGVPPAGGEDCRQEEEQEGEGGVPGPVERLRIGGGHLGAGDTPVLLHELRSRLQPFVRRATERQHVTALHPQPHPQTAQLAAAYRHD